MCDTHLNGNLLPTHHCTPGTCRCSTGRQQSLGSWSTLWSAGEAAPGRRTISSYKGSSAQWWEMKMDSGNHQSTMDQPLSPFYLVDVCVCLFCFLFFNASEFPIVLLVISRLSSLSLYFLQLYISDPRQVSL